MSALVWTPVVDPDSPPSNYGAAVAFDGASKWVMVGEGDFLISSDGRTWTSTPSPFGSGYNGASDIIWCDSLGLFVASGDTANAPPFIYTSSNGVTWTAQSTPWDSDYPAHSGVVGVYGLAWSHNLGQILALGQVFTGGHVIMTSTDGTTWMTRSTPADAGTNSYFSAGCWSPGLGLWVAAGSGNSGISLLSSPDGITWTTRQSSGAGSGVAWSPSLGLFVATNVSADASTSPDGVTWTSFSVLGTNTNKVCWSADYGLFVVTFSGASGVYSSPDGSTWSNEHVLPGDNFFGSQPFSARGLVLVPGRDNNDTTRLALGKGPSSGAHVNGFI